MVINSSKRWPSAESCRVLAQLLAATFILKECLRLKPPCLACSSPGPMCWSCHQTATNWPVKAGVRIGVLVPPQLKCKKLARARLP